MNSFVVLFRSPAFWTALISVVGMLLLRFTALPEDIWTALAIFLGSCVTILFGNDVAKAMGVQIARSQHELREEEKKNLTLMGRG